MIGMDGMQAYVILEKKHTEGGGSSLSKTPDGF
jgi:hypothetical protein